MRNAKDIVVNELRMSSSDHLRLEFPIWRLPTDNHPAFWEMSQGLWRPLSVGHSMIGLRGTRSVRWGFPSQGRRDGCGLRCCKDFPLGYGGRDDRSSEQLAVQSQIRTRAAVSRGAASAGASSYSARSHRSQSPTAPGSRSRAGDLLTRIVSAVLLEQPAQKIAARG